MFGDRGLIFGISFAGAGFDVWSGTGTDLIDG
jgi:hypothetical protein